MGCERDAEAGVSAIHGAVQGEVDRAVQPIQEHGAVGAAGQGVSVLRRADGHLQDPRGAGRQGGRSGARRGGPQTARLGRCWCGGDFAVWRGWLVWVTGGGWGGEDGGEDEEEEEEEEDGEGEDGEEEGEDGDAVGKKRRRGRAGKAGRGGGRGAGSRAADAGLPHTRVDTRGDAEKEALRRKKGEGGVSIKVDRKRVEKMAEVQRAFLAHQVKVEGMWGEEAERVEARGRERGEEWIGGLEERERKRLAEDVKWRE
ncbi:hypothetical protein CLOM_g18587, partial [Closterium sp. NIES-68]